MNQQSGKDTYYELSYYTLAHSDPSFIHQHIVDAYTAQTADEHTKPISLAFALVGLYLYLEKGYKGKQVQQAHIRMAKKRKDWPPFTLPEQRGDITVSGVLVASPGKRRDEMIRKWCVSVWGSWKGSRAQVMELAKSELDVS